MKFKNIVVTTVLSLSTIIGANSTVFALTYKDVPETHWAYSAISKISDLGYLVGDMSGNFEPNGYIDKFDTVDILAKMAGYKDSNPTTSEQVYQDNAYAKHKDFISQYSSKFTRWNPVRDKQIAYLLEKEILVQDDLNQFVILSSLGVEQMRALSREEISVFLVKLMGKQHEALAATEYERYADHDKISEKSRPYVYYLRKIGIISSNDSANNFSPNTAATRASVSFMLEKVLSSSAYTPVKNDTTIPSIDVTEVETISGTIVNLYPTINALQITSDIATYNNKILKASANAEIIIDGSNKSFLDLKTNMTFTAIYSAGEIAKITANTPAVTETPVTQPSTDTQTQTGNNTQNSVSELFTVDGKVTATSESPRSISIEVSMLNLKGEVYSEVRTYILGANCDIKQAGKAISLSDIYSGDLVSGKFNGNTIHSINVDVKDKNFSGKLLAKNKNNTTGQVTLKLADTNGLEYDLQVTEASELTRTGHGEVAWSSLRVGDDVKVVAEYDLILQLDATGTRTTADGTVQGIYISESGSFIEFKNTSTGAITQHPAPANLVDIYSLRIGSEINVRFDSSEILSLTVTKQTSSGTRKGYVSRVTRNTITITETPNSTTPLVEFLYDSNTVFTNAVSGGIANINNIMEQDLIYVVFDLKETNTATSVTILAK